MKKAMEIFLLYFKIGAFTIGGGYAMIPLIQEEIVEKKKWMTNEEFMDMFIVIQSAPGPIAINSAVFLGYKVGKTFGSIMATLGASLPSFIIILVVVMFFRDIREYTIVEKIFKGVRPGVVALISSAVYKLGKKSKLSKSDMVIAIGSLVAIVAFGLHPIILIVLSAVLGVLIARNSSIRERE